MEKENFEFKPAVLLVKKRLILCRIQIVEEGLGKYRGADIFFYGIKKVKSKVGVCSQGWHKGFLFKSYYTEVYGRDLLFSLDCSTSPLIRTL